MALAIPTKCHTFATPMSAQDGGYTKIIIAKTVGRFSSASRDRTSIICYLTTQELVACLP